MVGSRSISKAVTMIVALAVLASATVTQGQTRPQDDERRTWTDLRIYLDSKVAVRGRSGTVVDGRLLAVDDDSLTLVVGRNVRREVQRSAACSVTTAPRQAVKVALWAWTVGLGAAGFLVMNWLRGLGEHDEGAGAPLTGAIVGGAIGFAIGARAGHPRAQPRVLFRATDQTGCSLPSVP